MGKDTASSYFHKQSAVVPYRNNGGTLEVLLITSRRKKQWIVPKGVKEPHLSPQQSAAKEAFEEAGIAGKVSHIAIGTYQYQKWYKTCTVKVYCMKVQKVHDEWDEPWRRRKWVPLHAIPRRIKKEKLVQIVLSLPDFLQTKPKKWVNHGY